MKHLYEEENLLNEPFQCFYFDSEVDTIPITPHWHYYMEIIFVKNGVVKIYSDNREYFVKEGCVMLLHPKTIHAFYPVDEHKVSFIGIKLDINSMTFTSHYTPKLCNIFKAAQKKEKTILFKKSYVEKMQLDRIFEHCVTENIEKGYGYDIIIHAELYQLLTLMIRFWQQEGFKIDQEVFIEENNYDVFNILPFISQNLDRDLKVSEIAASCGLSYSHFAKRFQKVYGKSCKKYIEDLRISKVEELLLFTDFDLTSISQMTGFSDCSHMINSFKKQKRMTPKKFRMANQVRNTPIS